MSENERYSIEKDTDEILKSGVEVFLISASGEGICTAQAHIHQAIEFLYVTSETHRVFVNDDEYIVNTGDLIMFRSNSINRIYTTSPDLNEYVVIKIKPEIFSKLSSTDESSSNILRFVFHDKAKILWKCDEIESCAMIDSISAIRLELLKELPASDIYMKIAIVSLLVNILRLDAKLGSKSSYAGKVAVTRQIYKAITKTTSRIFPHPIVPHTSI